MFCNIVATNYGCPNGFLDTHTVVLDNLLVGLVGGTISDLTGGSFSNGVLTSALAYTFNQEGKLRSIVEEGVEALSEAIEFVENLRENLTEKLNIDPLALIEGENFAVQYDPIDIVRIYLALTRLGQAQGDDFLTDTQHFPPIRAMLARVVLGKNDRYTAAFFHHERSEALLLTHVYFVSDEEYKIYQDNAHNEVIANQGADSLDFFHPFIVRAYNTYFGPAYPRF